MNLYYSILFLLFSFPTLAVEEIKEVFILPEGIQNYVNNDNLQSKFDKLEEFVADLFSHWPGKEREILMERKMTLTSKNYYLPIIRDYGSARKLCLENGIEDIHPKTVFISLKVLNENEKFVYYNQREFEWVKVSSNTGDKQYILLGVHCKGVPFKKDANFDELGNSSFEQLLDKLYYNYFHNYDYSSQDTNSKANQLNDYLKNNPSESLRLKFRPWGLRDIYEGNFIDTYGTRDSMYLFIQPWRPYPTTFQMVKDIWSLARAIENFHVTNFILTFLHHLGLEVPNQVENREDYLKAEGFIDRTLKKFENDHF